MQEFIKQIDMHYKGTACWSRTVDLCKLNPASKPYLRASNKIRNNFLASTRVGDLPKVISSVKSDIEKRKAFLFWLILEWMTTLVWPVKVKTLIRVEMNELRKKLLAVTRMGDPFWNIILLTDIKKMCLASTRVSDRRQSSQTKQQLNDISNYCPSPYRQGESYVDFSREHHQLSSSLTSAYIWV